MNIDRIWYQKHILSYFLWPLSLLYRVIIAGRSYLYRKKIKKTIHFPVPVIIIGNITVGGTGKTPLVISIAKWLVQQGWRPGIVSRGYRGRVNKNQVQEVLASSDPRWVGDEAVLLVQSTGCPMFIGKNRVAAVTALLNQSNCNIVLSDDGLQHLALGREIEIAVIDGQRRFGNGFCLPAGPLREPISRLKTVDFRITNGEAEGNEWPTQLKQGEIYQITDPSRIFKPEMVQGKIIHAVAGIGHPQRFFNSLTVLGLTIIPHAYPDHYQFQAKDLNFGPDAWVIMTEKDAVKCRSFADERHWCLPVTSSLDPQFFYLLNKKLS